MYIDKPGITLIASFTDFGLTGPYQGQMAAVLASLSPQTPQVSLMADAPMFDPQSAGILLSSLCRYLPVNTLVLAVVDPGVGSNRRPIMIKTERNLFVGPDNGLFVPIIRRSTKFSVERIDWRPERLSESFHGRDLFAPVAAKLANGELVEGSPLKSQDMVGFNSPLDGNRIIYVDHFGNAITGIQAEAVNDDQVFFINHTALRYARTFSEAPVGQVFWFKNSMGLVEFAVNRGSAASLLALETGKTVEL